MLLLWVGVAALMFLTGCVDATSFAGDPGETARPAGGEYPTAYAPARPGPDDLILKWNGTLVVPEDRAPRPPEPGNP